MNREFSITSSFWAWHAGAPLAAAIVILLAVEHSDFDLWLADRWFALEGGYWAWRNHWVTSGVIHHYGKTLLYVFGSLLITFFLAGAWLDRFKRWLWPAGYVLACMILLPTMIACLKRLSPVPCPWDLSRYGGGAPYLHTFDYVLGSTAAGHCFPAGHASGGFALIALYFALLPYLRRPALMLVPGLVIGTVFALGQQARGAHFASHDLWSLTLCWFGALALFVLFRPQRWLSGPWSGGTST